MGSGYQVQSLAGQALQQKLIKNRSIRIIPIESKWSAPSAWANAVMVWAALPQNWKERSWLLSHYLYSWQICSGSRGEYLTLFCVCSASGMTGTDVRAGSCRYLLNQQTLLSIHFNTIILYFLYFYIVLKHFPRSANLKLDSDLWLKPSKSL